MTGSDHTLMALANRYGTPLFVYDGPQITRALGQLRDALHPAVTVLYPLWANSNIGIVGLLAGNGVTAGISSLTELRAATAAGIRPDRMLLLGTGRSRAELEACVSAGVHAVVVSSRAELAEVAGVAEARSIRQRVLLSVDASPADGRGGPADDGAPALTFEAACALAADLLAAGHPTLDIAGVHCDAGGPAPDPEAVVANTARGLDLADRFAAATGGRLAIVAAVSGLSVAGGEGCAEPDPKGLAADLHRSIDEFLVRHPDTRVLFDAGAFLTARNTTYIARVRYVIEQAGQNRLVIDGAAPHSPDRPIGRSANEMMPARLLGHPDGGILERWWIAGPLGIRTRDWSLPATLPRPRPGDLLGFARCDIRAVARSPELRGGHGLPAEVLVDRDDSYLIRSRDEPSDLLRKQRAHHPRPGHLDRAQVVDQIRRVAAVRLDHEAPVVSEQSKLTELGLDATGALELLLDLEQQAHFEVDPDQLNSAVFDTVGSLADYIMMRIRQTGRPARDTASD